MSREEIWASINSLKSAPVAIEALWDGDSTGWFVCLSAITDDGQTHPLGVLSYGGDIRLFSGQVPPWPEAVAARELGNELAKRFGAEFYFPSPDHPEEDCPDWKHRNKGYPCRKCGILLLQPPDCPWHGICCDCHLDEEREQREAGWTPEQRVGPRCHICGNPATNELNGEPVCTDCFDKYQVYTCEKCGFVTLIPKSVGHASLCRTCEIRRSIDSLTASQRNIIREAMAKGPLEGIRTTMHVMGCSLYEAVDVVHVLGGSNAAEDLG